MGKVVDHLLSEKPGADTLVVYLSAANVGCGVFNWIRAAEGQQGHALFLSDARNHWYLDGVEGLGSRAETVAWIAATADRLGTTKLRFIGSSMGAFGALLYAKMLKGPALAFSPEAELDRLYSRSARWRRGGIAETVVGTNATVIFGESEICDLWAAARLKADGGHIIGLRGVDHHASTAVNKAGLLGQVLSCFISDGAVHTLDGMVQPAREQGRWHPVPSVGAAVDKPEHVQAMSAADLAFRARDWNRLETLARKALETYPVSDLAHHLLGVSMLMQGRPEEALPSLSAALSLSERRPEYRHMLGSAFRKLGLAAEAKAAQMHVLRRWPAFGKADYALALIAQTAGDQTEAVFRLKRAIASEPKRTEYRARLDKITINAAAKEP